MLDRVVLRKIRDYFLKEEGELPKGSLKILRGEKEVKAISHVLCHYSRVRDDCTVALVWTSRKCIYDTGEVYDDVTWAGFSVVETKTGYSPIIFRGKKTDFDEIEFLYDKVVYFKNDTTEWDEWKLEPCFRNLAEKIRRDIGKSYNHLVWWLGSHVTRCDRLTMADLQNLIPRGVSVEIYCSYSSGRSVIGDFLLERNGKLMCVGFRNTTVIEEYPECLFAPDDDDPEPEVIAEYHYTDSLQDGDLIWGIRIVICDECDENENEVETIILKHPILWVNNKKVEKAA